MILAANATLSAAMLATSLVLAFTVPSRNVVSANDARPGHVADAGKMVEDQAGEKEVGK